MSTKQSPQLTVKIYYQENGENKEIRKFSLDEEMVTNYEYLMGKIKLYFTSLLRKELELFWKDADDDLILMSSDEELFELLKTVRCDADCLKLYIKEKAPSTRREPTGDAHPGIICDGCDKNIVGLRYICTVCPNFDLCEICEKKGTHSTDHDMLCIKKPRTSSYQMPGFFCVNSSVNGGPWKTHTSSSQQSGKPKEKGADGFSSSNSTFTPPPPPPPPPFHGAPPFPHPSHFHGAFNHHFGPFASSFGVNPSVAASFAASAAQSMFTQPQTSCTSSSSSTSTSTSSTSTSTGGPCPMGGQFPPNIPVNINGISQMAEHVAKSVGQQFTNNPDLVSQLMNPLFPGTTPTPQRQTNSTETPNASTTTNPEQMARNLAQSFASNPEFISGVMKTFLNSCTVQPQQQQQQQQQQQSSPPEATQQPSQEPQQSPEAPEIHPQEETKNDYVSQNENSEEPMVLTADTDVDDNQSSSRLKYDPVTKNYVVVDRDANGELSEEELYEQRLDEAIHQMMSMGFDNDNGWLKQLLISKDLDIGRVLDAMNKTSQA